MSANFYLSSHANQHLHPRATLVAARELDLKHATEHELVGLEIWSAGAMQKICKRLTLRQQVLSTAIVYFRRFFLRNSYCETDPPLVAAASVYVAAKAEETPVHVKSAVSEAKAVFNEMGILSFTSDNNRLAEMEFYLIEELDFHLIVYHPYRALLQLCGRDGGANAGGEPGREQRRAMLEMEDATFQMAWFIINDTFRSSLCLVHPPHLIALAAIYLSLSMHPSRALLHSISTTLDPPPAAPPSSSTSSTTGDTSRRASLNSSVSSRTRRRSIDDPALSTSTMTTTTTTTTKPSRSATALKDSTNKPGGLTDPLTFLASLEVDQSIVLEIIQEVCSLYELWALVESGTGALPPLPPPSSSSSSASSTTTAATGANTTSTTTSSAPSPSSSSSNPGSTTNPTGRGTPLVGSTMDQRMGNLIRRMQESRLRELKDERARAGMVGGGGGGGGGGVGSLGSSGAGVGKRG
ncbi:hypothetical protein JCM10212_005858 [Sporobolomyces blumeae]